VKKTWHILEQSREWRIGLVSSTTDSNKRTFGANVMITIFGGGKMALFSKAKITINVCHKKQHFESKSPFLRNKNRDIGPWFGSQMSL
jgi:hypothetical protein